jgi:hypothetical protein
MSGQELDVHDAKAYELQFLLTSRQFWRGIEVYTVLFPRSAFFRVLFLC